jgi:hypothetical protein
MQVIPGLKKLVHPITPRRNCCAKFNLDACL